MGSIILYYTSPPVNIISWPHSYHDTNTFLQKHIRKQTSFVNKYRILIPKTSFRKYTQLVPGETSSGKSTLINKILKKNVFQGRTNESTSTICKLRNSEKITIKVEHNNDVVKEIDIPEDICMETPEGIENLRELLMRYTDLTTCTESKEYQCVDIGLPIPFLKVILNCIYSNFKRKSSELDLK